MFEEVDSLGVSQGQGRGFAQVFDSTYNPVFKEETARLIKEDKEGKKAIDKQLESIDSGVWFRDQPLVQEKILELQKYAQDNPRNIIKGNTNEALEYKKKITDLKALVYNSKLAEQQTSKYLFALKQDGDKWDQEESRKTIQQFVESPGNYDFTNFQLVPSFSMAKYEKQFMQPEVSKLINTITQSSKKDEFGNYNYDQVEKTSKDAMDNWANRMWNDSNSKMKQTYGSLDEFKQAVYDYGNLELKKNVKTPPSESLSKQAEKKPNKIIYNKNLNFSQKVGGTKTPIYGDDYETVGFTDSETVSLAGTGFNVPDVANFTPNQFKNMNGVIFSMTGAYQAEKTKDGLKLKGGVKLKDSQNLIDALIEDQGVSDFSAQSIELIPVFKKGKKIIAKTKNGRKVNLSNTIISKEMLEEGKIYDIVLSDDNVEYVPYVIGDYNKVIDKDTQTNFVAGIPYSEYALSMENKSNTRNELVRFEEQEEVKNDLLKTYSFTEGNKKAGIKTNQPTQTKKEPSDTNNKIKQARTAYDALVKAAKEKGSTNIPTFEKYLELKGIK